MGKLHGVAAGVAVAILVVAAARADGPDISAGRLLASWKDDDPGTRMVAEVIASAFASGFSWGGDAAGKHTYCASPRRALWRGDGGDAHTRISMRRQELVPMGDATVIRARPAPLL